MHAVMIEESKGLKPALESQDEYKSEGGMTRMGITGSGVPRTGGGGGPILRCRADGGLYSCARFCSRKAVQMHLIEEL